MKTDQKLEITGVEIAWVEPNPIRTPHFIYENDHRNKINIFGDFENEITTHIGAAHAFSKVDQNFQNRSPRELNQSFDIPRISMIHLISSNFLN